MLRKSKCVLFIVCTLFFSTSSIASVAVKNINLYDASRHRIIPILIYADSELKDTTGKSIVIINHGYTVKNSEYSFIANKLASQGYTVISIQHDLKNDPTFPTTGTLYLKRKPLWERGVQNILFVIAQVHLLLPNVNTKKLILIGHSNGGDISMLFATHYPNLVSKVISLDSLRMPFPRDNHFKILSLRAIDTKADDGVLPTLNEQKTFDIQLIKLKNAKHIDLCDRGSSQIKNEVNEDVLNFLK